MAARVVLFIGEEALHVTATGQVRRSAKEWREVGDRFATSGQSRHEYCRQEQITFTRSRPYRKNDNCFVEQKNYSIVRRAVGYARYDTEEQCMLLNELYSYLRLYTNFFQPTMKLKSKQREGSKVKKCYDQALTPYQRVMQSTLISKPKKQLLRTKYATLNPAALKRKIEGLQQRLAKTSSQTNWRECARMVAVTAAQRTNAF